MEIVEVTTYSEEVLEAINDLIPQLSSNAGSLCQTDLEQLISMDTTHLLMASEGGMYYGSLTLIVFGIPTGTRAWIEDVVVNQSARGRGVGRLLSEYAISLAKKLGCKTVDLTSRPSREAANALYKKIGFEKRETNVYRYINI